MRYKKKPVIIEAIQWDGHNDDEIREFLGIDFAGMGDNLVAYKPESEQYRSKLIYISTLEGTMEASVGDYIIRGINGEHYPCNPDIFEKTYDEDNLLDDENFMFIVVGVPKQSVSLELTSKIYDNHDFKTLHADLTMSDIQNCRQKYLELDPTDDHFDRWVLNE